MKLLSASEQKLVFHLGKREKTLLCGILALYPRVPPAHKRPLSRSGKVPDAEGNQKLLDEALTEQRAANKKHLEALLANPKKLSETPSGWHLTLKPGEFEWLLQILNDVRVGSWLSLGSPENIHLNLLSEKTAPDFWAMEMSGHFQMRMLAALEDRAST